MKKFIPLVLCLITLSACSDNDAPLPSYNGPAAPVTNIDLSVQALNDPASADTQTLYFGQVQGQVEVNTLSANAVDASSVRTITLRNDTDVEANFFAEFLSTPGNGQFQVTSDNECLTSGPQVLAPRSQCRIVFTYSAVNAPSGKARAIMAFANELASGIKLIQLEADVVGGLDTATEEAVLSAAMTPFSGTPNLEQPTINSFSVANNTNGQITNLRFSDVGPEYKIRATTCGDVLVANTNCATFLYYVGQSTSYPQKELVITGNSRVSGAELSQSLFLSEQILF